MLFLIENTLINLILTLVKIIFKQAVWIAEIIVFLDQYDND